MSDRDTLYDLLDGLLPEREIVRSDIAGAMVEAIEAAGWRPPAPEVANPDELPPGSIVLRDGVAWHRDAGYWHLVCGGHARWDSPFGPGSITIVHVPAEDTGR